MSKVFITPCNRLALTAVLGWLLVAPALGLPEDREQPIHIESDRAERQERTGLTTYEGDVVITQGTIRVEADRVVVHTEGSQVARIEATGNPARYQQVLEQGDAPLRASSRLIEYQVQQEQIILSRDARLEQQGSTITGERIEYDLVQEIIRAQGDLEGRQRIRMVIPPAAQQRPEEATASETGEPSADTDTLEEAPGDAEPTPSNGN